jgi:uncharacterized oxidoreductase
MVMATRKTVLITGGSFGLGLAMAHGFSKRGFQVIACARTTNDLEAAARAIPGLETIRADVADPLDRARVMDKVTGGGRPLDILVNNAAISRAHDYADPFTLAVDRASDEIAINLAAPIELIRLFLDHRRRAGLEAQAATIVNVSTPGALFPLEANPLYSTTKAGLHMFTLALRRQLKASPVKVIEVFPPALDTRLADELAVPSQVANGPEVIAEVAEAIVADILAGTEVSLPHKQSRQLYGAVQHLDEAFLDRVNSGVKRREGWNRPS